MRQIKQSETRTINRSQINLNPVNPKRHSDDKVKLQKKNFQKVGFLGGIVWNERTGNLIDGHRRIQAMDLFYKYDGTEETDYEVKVEVVNLDEKTEKEQLAYMAVGNTKPDIDLLAELIPDIDYSDVGLSDSELNEILAVNAESVEEIESLDDIIETQAEEPVKTEPKTEEKTYEEKKEHMKDVKQQVKEAAFERQQKEDAYVMLSFSSADAKADFCDLLGISTDDKFAKGEDVLNLIG